MLDLGLAGRKSPSPGRHPHTFPRPAWTFWACRGAASVRFRRGLSRRLRPAGWATALTPVAPSL